jgi:hypothetical protein
MDTKDQLPFDFSQDVVSKSSVIEKDCDSRTVKSPVLSITEKIEAKKKDYETTLYSRIVARAKHLL